MTFVEVNCSKCSKGFSLWTKENVNDLYLIETYKEGNGNEISCKECSK